MKRHIPYLLLFISVISCTPATKESNDSNDFKNQSHIKYAKGFDIIIKDNKKYLVIKKAFQNSDKVNKYLLTNKTDINKNEIKIPIKKIVVTSTTHVPMLELLSVENKLIGFPNTQYISSIKTRKLIEKGTVKEIGSAKDMNTEKLIELSPDLVVGFSLHPNNRVYENIKKTGIPVIFNGEWLEETPLGRAEWIKFFGVLFDKEVEADSIFTKIENNYQKAKTLASKSNYSPTIISGSLYKDVWNLPAGESFIASLFKDGNINYLWKETTGTGSLQYSLESVLDRGHNADYWIGCGLVETKKDLITSNQHYKKFTSVENDKVYTIAAKKGATGGLIYFEQSPVRPDLLLKDLIKITNPALLPNHTLYFLKKLQ